MLASNTNSLPFMTYNSAIIHFLLQYHSEIGMCPASFIRRINKLLCPWMLASVILSRSFNTTLIQSTCPISQTHLGNSHIKYLPNNCCRLWISNQFMLIFRIEHNFAEGGHSSHLWDADADKKACLAIIQAPPPQLRLLHTQKDRSLKAFLHHGLPESS